MITFKKLGRLGRFGNQLFQYTGTRLYAEKNGFKFAFPAWIGNQVFRDSKPWSLGERASSIFCHKTQLKDYGSYDRTDILPWLFSKNKRLPELNDLKRLYENPQDNLDFLGYLQDDLSFDTLFKNRPMIKTWFEFKDQLKEQFKQAVKNEKPWIGVHIRKEDFMKRGMDLPSSKYKEKLEDLKNEFGDHKIFIATNSPSVASEFNGYNILKLNNPISNLPAYIFDFWMLKNADVIIGGGSTFSWWAAYLSKNDKYLSPPLTHLWPKGYVPKIQEQRLI